MPVCGQEMPEQSPCYDVAVVGSIVKSRWKVFGDLWVAQWFYDVEVEQLLIQWHL
jgi:hypothetical protein